MTQIYLYINLGHTIIGSERVKGVLHRHRQTLWRIEINHFTITIYLPIQLSKWLFQSPPHIAKIIIMIIVEHV